VRSTRAVMKIHQCCGICANESRMHRHCLLYTAMNPGNYDDNSTQ
jgi:hypothetical protein